MVHKGMGELRILNYDKWLSEIFSRPVYCMKFDRGLREKLRDEKSKEYLALNRFLTSSPIFIYIKVPTEDPQTVQLVEKAGFHLIETNVTYEKEIDKNYAVPDNNCIRLASLNDQNHVTRLAEENFIFSRFHMDPSIPNELANKVKKEWAKNYFSGNRGDKMVIGEINDGVIGFLQILEGEDNTVIIDLIAVDKNHRRKNIASDLIACTELEYDDYSLIRVGTQISNIPSIRLYEKLGFRLTQSQYIFHYHG